MQNKRYCLTISSVDEADSMVQKDVESLIYTCLCLHKRSHAWIICTQIIGSLLYQQVTTDFGIKNFQPLTQCKFSKNNLSTAVDNSFIGMIRGYFCDGTCWNAVPEALSQKDTSRNLFFPDIDITRLGMSCYPTALLTN
jgi:hypothetical protein